MLNSNDTIFKEIRDLNQSYVGGVIQKKAVSIEKEIGEKIVNFFFLTVNNPSLTNIKNFFFYDFVFTGEEKIFQAFDTRKITI